MQNSLHHFKESTSLENNPLLRAAIRSVLQGAMLSGAVAATCGVGTAQAQQPTAANASDEPLLQEVVVTGSRIKQPALEAVSPVTTVSAVELQQTGYTRVEDMLNTLPQVTADQGGALANGATGVANIGLRGLGPQRTLVLIDGRRLMPGDPTSGGNAAPDLNQVPAALVERIDVLTGGASAVYGADAVAGVVNFVMNDHFEGVRIDANASMYNHGNHNADAADADLMAAGFPGTERLGERRSKQRFHRPLGQQLCRRQGQCHRVYGLPHHTGCPAGDARLQCLFADLIRPQSGLRRLAHHESGGVLDQR